MNDFNWDELYRFAEHLNNDYSFSYQEAVQRTIVSRAYYAAFCMAREVLKHKYKISIPQNAASHEYVRIEYEKRGLNNISDSLANLRKYRNCCDYDNSVKDLHRIVNESLILSENIIRNL